MYNYSSSVFCIVPQKVLLLIKIKNEVATWKVVTIMQRWYKMQE